METRFNRIREKALEGIEERIDHLNKLHMKVKYTDKLFMRSSSVGQFLSRLREIEKLSQEIFEPSPNQRKSLESVRKIEEFYLALYDLLNDD